MLSCFLTSNYYDNDEYIEYNNVYLDKVIDDTDVCLICWEREKGEEILSKMSDIVVKSCACNSLMHMSCFHHWKIKTNSCPICRDLFDKNKSEFLDEDTGFSIYMSLLRKNVCDTSKRILRFCAFVSVLTLITNITLHIIVLQQFDYNELMK